MSKGSVVVYVRTCCRGDSLRMGVRTKLSVMEASFTVDSPFFNGAAPHKALYRANTRRKVVELSWR